MKKTGEIFDAKRQLPLAQQDARRTKIMGAPVASDSPPTTLDARSKTEQPPVETTTHMDTVTVREHVRSRPAKKGEPEVRVRSMSKEDRANWNRVKRAEDQ